VTTATLFCSPVYKAKSVKAVNTMLTKAVVLVIAAFSVKLDPPFLVMEKAAD
jgi:hypothetical protein